ncbi:hypothetical protein BS50DRAFT_7165 [Corynespora cassiicola Philippines]|uniref:Uncharacterized protein n=1 Tax=Corynespora cassiicola Philippines TaxID=1448308 RepID=A0A2T2P8V3_CORCC|nr:hypothetical protein BS50DRAFT_7165 [Corynespora cassiicola Philippines]
MPPLRLKHISQPRWELTVLLPLLPLAFTLLSRLFVRLFHIEALFATTGSAPIYQSTAAHYASRGNRFFARGGCPRRTNTPSDPGTAICPRTPGLPRDNVGAFHSLASLPCTVHWGTLLHSSEREIIPLRLLDQHFPQHSVHLAIFSVGRTHHSSTVPSLAVAFPPSPWYPNCQCRQETCPHQRTQRTQRTQAQDTFWFGAWLGASLHARHQRTIMATRGTEGPVCRP